MKKTILFFCAFAICTISFSQVSLPVHDDPIVTHAHYSLGYSEDHEQASWVFYKIYWDMVNTKTKRVDAFAEDAKVETGSATLADYRGSGYDRGHLCPAGSMKISKEAMRQCFFMSNMSPQVRTFNQRIWNNLENAVRKWVGVNDTIYVATAGIFKDNIGTIGKNEVTIPGYYYKILYRTPSEHKPATMVAFLMKNEECEWVDAKSYDKYIVSVDKVEEEPGIDFFSGVENEKELEAVAKFFD